MENVITVFQIAQAVNVVMMAAVAVVELVQGEKHVMEIKSVKQSPVPCGTVPRLLMGRHI